MSLFTRTKYNEEEFRNAVSSSESMSECLRKLNLVPRGKNVDTFKKYIKKLDIDISHFKWVNNPHKRRLESITKAKFLDAVKCSLSVSQLLRKLNLSDTNNNRLFIKRSIDRLGADTSHFTGQLWSKGRKLGYKYPIEDYTNGKRLIASYRLLSRLVEEKIFDRKCYKCSRRKWNKIEIPLELHHIDGNSKNNMIDNIIPLCRNCHAQTDNWCKRKDVPKSVKHLN